VSLAYIALLLLLMPARIGVYTLAAWGMMVWAVPMLVEDGASPASIIFCGAVLSCLLAHVLAKPAAKPTLLPSEIARNAAILHHLLFATIIAIDGGFSGFLSGKYGALPGGNIELYYAWNSSLYIAFAAQVFSQRVRPIQVSVLLIALSLIVIKGDRTILAFVVIALGARMSFGLSPLAILLRFRAVGIGILAIGVLFVAKDLYGLYAEGRNWKEIFEAIDLEQIFSRLESWHNYDMLNNIVAADLYYSLSDFIVEPLAVIPGSWLADVDPHRFSILVKESFYTEWSESAGVGASYFGQFYALGGGLGVAGGILVLLLWLYVIYKGLRSRQPWVVFMSIAVLPILTFYMHRNAVAQIASFAGRYLIVATAIYLSTRIPIRLGSAKPSAVRPHA
jgi:hypothetical protein